MDLKKIFILLSLPVLIFSQEIDSVGSVWPQMFPLNIGDFRNYREAGVMSGGYSEKIIKDTVLADGKTYFVAEIDRYWEEDIWEKEYKFYRVDSLGHVWFGPDTSYENYWLSLDVATGDTIFNHPTYFNNWLRFLVYVGKENDKIIVDYYYSGMGKQIWLLEGIGLVKHIPQDMQTITLIGAVINGEVYGDTSYVVKINDDIIPQNFKLFQNYPNPFNPSTQIDFEINHSGNAKINVYDIKGGLVSNIANQRFSIGKHSVIFDGKNLPSGTYFYRIESNGRSTTKKMILIK